ncbi:MULTISPECIES: hypothetical protein [unclassified Streptomyces]|uniref:hypothetical protein n=1 Tax=unclassified Streptomyces TaxID=2593676 RepID=UPI0037FE8BC8
MDGLVPHQSPAPDRAASGDQPRWESAPTPTPDRWEDVQEHQQQLRHGVERERGCEGDDGLCDRLAVVGETQCAEHLGWPLCPGHDGSSCARRTRDGGQCATCQGQEHYARMADALPEPESDNGRCPGYNAPCGRGITIVGLCPRCRIASQHDRDRIEKEWREAAAAAVATAEAEEAAQGVPVPF